MYVFKCFSLFFRSAWDLRRKTRRTFRWRIRSSTRLYRTRREPAGGKQKKRFEISKKIFNFYLSHVQKCFKVIKLGKFYVDRTTINFLSTRSYYFWKLLNARTFPHNKEFSVRFVGSSEVWFWTGGFKSENKMTLLLPIKRIFPCGNDVNITPAYTHTYTA